MSTSMQAARETDSLLASSSSSQTLQRSKCCCKLTYKPRRFVSKGATLILAWNTLIFASMNGPVFVRPVDTIVSYLALFLAAIISAWLADARLGRYRVVQAGLVLLWLGSLLKVVANTLDAVHSVNPNIRLYLSYASSIAIYAGVAAILINIVQFGIEQMPDASAEQITSFISWYVLTIPAGLWMHQFIQQICEPFRSLLQQTLLSIVLCSHILLKHWLINHRQTYSPLKTVYQVLKYAKQHKYPVNRSASTYWEEEIPSRIDLGKTKYGGPFTTEQVEDVKTLLRILVILTTLALFIANGTFTYAAFQLLKPSNTTTLLQPSNMDPNTPIPKCVQIDMQKYINGYLTAVALILLYEVLFYPVFKHHIPSMLKRIGICVLANVPMSLVLVMDTTMVHFNLYSTTLTRIQLLLAILLISILIYILATAMFEFINAQTPENMKGFTAAITYLTIFFAVLVGTILKVPIKLTHCSINSCAIIVAVVCAVLSIAISVLYCFIARWYKRRDREELFNAQAIIEDIYSRRVEQNEQY